MSIKDLRVGYDAPDGGLWASGTYTNRELAGDRNCWAVVTDSLSNGVLRQRHGWRDRKGRGAPSLQQPMNSSPQNRAGILCLSRNALINAEFGLLSVRNLTNGGVTPCRHLYQPTPTPDFVLHSPAKGNDLARRAREVAPVQIRHGRLTASRTCRAVGRDPTAATTSRNILTWMSAARPRKRISDPPGGKVPYQPWALAKRNEIRAGLARGWPGEKERLYTDPHGSCPIQPWPSKSALPRATSEHSGRADGSWSEGSA
jgi:hypothetical protein